MNVCHPGVMDERLNNALCAIQRVEEALAVHADTDWGRSPETQEIRNAIADIDAGEGGWEPVFGAAPPTDEHRMSTRRPPSHLPPREGRCSDR